MKCFINPGHAPGGNPDPGAVSAATGLRESDVAANVGKLAADYLRAAGVDVFVFQSDSLGTICREANEGADIFVSIHCNSAASVQANGTETFCHAGSSRGRVLAQCIQSQIVNSVDVTDRGVKTAGFYVLTNTDMPAVLVELAFISNAHDEKLLAAKQDDFARAIARGVTDYQRAQP